MLAADDYVGRLGTLVVLVAVEVLGLVVLLDHARG